MLGILNNTAAGKMQLEQGLPSADWLHFYTEAARLAFADRGQFIADPDFVQALAAIGERYGTPTTLKSAAPSLAHKA